MINNTKNKSIQRELNSKIKRHDIINHLIAKNNFDTYLEIGIFDGFTFNQVKCQNKTGVDPGIEGIVIPQVTHKMTSDDFFKICDRKYDIIFIDGLHEYTQVVKDFNNAVDHINDNGYILFHDCNPPDEESQYVPRQTVSWNGDVWKAFILIKEVNPHAYVLDTDFGIGVVFNNSLNKVSNIENVHSLEEFFQNKKELLSLRHISKVEEV